MSLLKVVLVVLNASVIRAFIISPTDVSTLRVSFLGLAAAPQELNNAFDLIDDALRVTLSDELGIVQPNEIQNSSLPCAIRGDDTFVIAQTGSGKTMSFMLPILHRLNSSSQRSVAIVIGPTAELLAQHSTVASTLMPSVSERILFKTPEQVLESSTADDEDFANIDIVAIDEVDAVLCGSEFNDTTPETSIELLDRLSDRAQYILTTAHLTRAHTKIINRLFPDINTIRQSSSSRRVLVPTLRQVFHYFSGDMSAKLDKLQEILEDSETQPTIVFCKDENEVEAVHLFIENCNALKDGFSPEKLHVDLPSEVRSNALSRFRANDCRMLVTHEIAARGLDCPFVRHVILFDTPTDVTAFVHRAGRTARAGEEGVVTCMVQAGGGGGIGSFGDSGGSFGKHKNLHALLDAPKLNFAKAIDDDIE
jgi:ATP-dependent RNA helicase DeaD